MPYVSSNGWLFDPGSPPARTVFGDNYATLTGQVTALGNLFPVRLWTDPPVITGATSSVTVTLYAEVANDGEVSTGNPSVAGFYKGVPPDGSLIEQTRTVVDLTGCGSSVTVSVTLTGLTQGAHPVYVTVDADAAVTEVDETDNTLAWTIFVNPHRTYLPLIARN